MKYKIIYKEESLLDLKEASELYKFISEDIHEKFVLALLDAEVKLTKYPTAFAILKNKKFRRILLGVFPYKLIYHIEEINKEVIVFGLLHTARSTKHLKRIIKR